MRRWCGNMFNDMFTSIPAIAPDGTAHLQTRVYPEGISYITKLLRKYGYLEVA